MTIYKPGQGFELRKTENKSSKWLERDLNPGPLDCECDTLTSSATLPELLWIPPLALPDCCLDP